MIALPRAGLDDTSGGVVSKDDRVAVEVLDPLEVRRTAFDKRREDEQLSAVAIENTRLEATADQSITWFAQVDAIERHVRRIKADRKASAIMESHEAAAVERQSLRPVVRPAATKHPPVVRSSPIAAFELERQDAGNGDTLR
ncbi:hypothetical protein WT01_19035 [Burkholderia cepacia]|nr:hypothetical protein WT01_19035 [Burkholderia cepacia]